MATTYWLKFGNTPIGYNDKGVTFTHVEAPGTLTITLSGSGTGFDPDRALTTNVAFGSAISYTVNGVPVQSPSASYTASLKDGESVVLGNIPFGTTYSVTETISLEDALDGYSAGTVTNGSGTMTDAGAITATANYLHAALTPLADHAIRCRFSAAYTPAMGDSQTLMNAQYNVWDIYKAGTSWRNLFKDCAALEAVIAANSTGVTDTYGMFNGCSNLESVPLFDTSAVTAMPYMFNGCSKLQSVPLFDTGSATAMNFMFRGCTSLTSVPLFNTSSAVAMAEMFMGCTSLTSVPLFNTSNVYIAYGMFSGCASLTSVPLFDTSGVLNLTYMFKGCTSLTSIPLFTISSRVYDVTDMFNGCTEVQSGALALYSRLAGVRNLDHARCFRDCGVNTVTGAAELAQIPSSWK